MPVMAFDLDMTLIDSRVAILAAFDAAARELDVLIELADVDARLGLRLEDELAHWVPVEDVEAAAAAYRRHYVSLAVETRLLAGVAAALDYVRHVGASLVVVTAKAQEVTEVCLDAVRLKPDAVFCHVDSDGKTAALRECGAELYVGDAPSDMRAATEAGVSAVGVATGSFSRSDLESAGASVVLGNLREFPTWHRRLAANGTGAAS